MGVGVVKYHKEGGGGGGGGVGDVRKFKSVVVNEEDDDIEKGKNDEDKEDDNVGEIEGVKTADDNDNGDCKDEEEGEKTGNFVEE